MTTVLRRPVGRSLPDLLDWAERLPEALAWANLPAAQEVHSIRVEEFIEDGTYTVRAELPGMDPERDISVEVDGGLMTIRAERREERHERGTTEFHYGRSERRIALPEGADEDQINARYDAGVLTVTVPVREQAARPRSIPVQRSAEDAGRKQEQLGAQDTTKQEGSTQPEGSTQQEAAQQEAAQQEAAQQE
jgi:HSP20 family protein